MDDLSDYLTTSQAAALLGVSARTFARRAALPGFPQATRPDLKVALYRRSELVEWMSKQAA